MRTASTVAKVVILAGLGLLAINSAHATEAKCTQQSYVCADVGPNARPRTCVTTVCTDDKGNIVSTNTVVLNQGNNAGSGDRNPVKLSGAAGVMRRAN